MGEWEGEVTHRHPDHHSFLQIAVVDQAGARALYPGMNSQEPLRHEQRALEGKEGLLVALFSYAAMHLFKAGLLFLPKLF